tara:strand:+ start:6245 stop:7006 length:762 start_codon:yes stop_codon:yes gene_type:complete
MPGMKMKRRGMPRYATMMERGMYHTEKGPMHKEKGPMHKEKGMMHKEMGMMHKEKGGYHDEKGMMHSEKGPGHEGGDMAEQPPAEGMDATAQMESELDQLAKSAPPPDKPYSVKSLETLTKQINDTMSKISAEPLPQITLDSSAAQNGKIDAPIPADVFLALVAIAQLIAMVSGGDFVGKFGFDPFGIANDTDLRKVTAQLKMMAKDKKFIEGVAAIQQGPEMAGDEGPQEADMSPAPTEMNEDDDMLRAGMQ